MKKTEAEKWLSRAKKLSESIPDGLEAVLTYGGIHLYKKGSLEEHTNSSDGWAGSGSGLTENEIGMECVSLDFIPYSEGH